MRHSARFKLNARYNQTHCLACSRKLQKTQHRFQTRTFTSSVFLKNATASGQKTRTKRHRLILDSRNDGGGERDRTDDLLLAKQALSQLSYTPDKEKMVGLDGFEPSTPALSRRCSNQLSYRPVEDPGRGCRIEKTWIFESSILNPNPALQTTDKCEHLARGASLERR